MFIHVKKTFRALQCQCVKCIYKKVNIQTQHVFWFPVKDIKISDIFYKIQKFLKISWATIIMTYGIHFFWVEQFILQIKLKPQARVTWTLNVFFKILMGNVLDFFHAILQSIFRLPLFFCPIFLCIYFLSVLFIYMFWKVHFRI